jgi:integrase
VRQSAFPWAEVDLVGRNLAVSEQIVQVGYLTETGPPKSDSARVVVLDADSVAVLQSHKVSQNQERLAWGPGWVNSGLVFTREDGTALHPEYVSRHFERLAGNAGLPPVRLHDLRHGAATLALAGGADLKTVPADARRDGLCRSEANSPVGCCQVVVTNAGLSGPIPVP